MPRFDFVLAGRYKLVAPLGDGGMASVYRARDLRLNREVAVKILREELTADPEFLARFEREAQVVASLSHPNIVPVYDVGEEDGSHFIVMEYVRGRTLREEIERDGRLPPEQAIHILVPVLDALGYAHSRGLIHRDVKPHNILLSADGTPRLADFGIAHLVDGSTTRTAAILGSAEYLSPEQSRGEEATARSDIYACGIVLYEMLAGRPPFSGPNALAIAHQHLNTPPPPLSAALHAVEPGLDRAVHTALAKDPLHRFADTAAFASALKSLAPREETSFQPLARQGESTAVQPLHAKAEDSDTAAERERDGTIVVQEQAAPRIEIRRSTRKVVVFAVFLACLVAILAYAVQISTAHLPQYPSAPYAAVPGLYAALVLTLWLNSRSWRYTLDRNAAVVQWGLVGHHRLGVPLRTVITLELKQSPIDRVLGVGTVDLCARDQHGAVRHLVMEDVENPRERYDELLQLLSWVSRTKSAVERARV